MQWFGPSTTVKTVDGGDGLRVRVAVHRFRIDLILYAGVFAVFAYVGWRNRSWFFLIVVLVAGASLVIDWLKDPTTELWVTEHGLEAVRDNGGLGNDRLRLPWSEISGLDYRVGGEDEPGGLYARRGGWRSTFLMAHVNKEQAEEIIAAIYRRFPYVEMATDDGGWLPFGGKSDLTTLGLSKSDHDG